MLSLYIFDRIKLHKINTKEKAFMKIVVLERAENRGKHTMWKCKCDCGNYTITGASELKSGKAKNKATPIMKGSIKVYASKIFLQSDFDIKPDPLNFFILPYHLP
mgnify:CR=1 FL=1